MYLIFNIFLNCPIHVIHAIHTTVNSYKRKCCPMPVFNISNNKTTTRKPVGFTQSCFLSFACTPCRRVHAHHAVMCAHTMSCACTPCRHVCAHHAVMCTHHVVCAHTMSCVCTPCHHVNTHHVMCVHTTPSCARTPCCVHARDVVHTTPWCTFQSNLTPKSCDHSSQPISRLHSLKSL